MFSDGGAYNRLQIGQRAGGDPVDVVNLCGSRRAEMRLGARDKQHMMNTAVEVAATIVLAVIGLSHVCQHRVWAHWTAANCARGRVGVFQTSFPALLVGSLIVGFDNVWTGVPAILTSIGWSLVLKSTVALLFPDVALRAMARVRPEHSRLLWIPGIIMIAVALLLVYSLYHRNSAGAPDVGWVVHREE